MTAPSRQRILLSGAWTFGLDPEDVGLSEQWFRAHTPLPDRIRVPGALQAQGAGDGRHLSAICQSRGMPPQQVETCSYRGTAWYRRSFSAPEPPPGGRAWLCVGGVHPRAEFWIDGRPAGAHEHALLEGRIDVTDLLQPGAGHVLTVRISEHPDDPAKPGQRNWGDPLQGGIMSCMSTWSGIWRDLALETTAAEWLEHVHMIPDPEREQAHARIRVRASGPAAERLAVRIRVTAPDGADAGTVEQALEGAGPARDATVSVPIAAPHPWSPDDPALYRVTVTLLKDGRPVDERADRFGMRTIAIRDNEILLNGRPVFLRGYGDDAVYPRTLCPPTDRAQLEKELRQARAYGFNYVDHLYGLPHREYLDLCDELGLLVQCYPGWTSTRMAMNGQQQARRMHLEAAVGQVMNHPSVVVYSFAAEVYHLRPGVKAEIADLAAAARAVDPSRVHAATGGIDRNCVHRDPTDILEMALDYTNTPADLACQTKPVVLHEYRWWSSYPDPSIKHKYADAAMRPYFIEYAERVAADKGLSEWLPAFVRNSQARQAQERKIGMEKARRGPDVRGYAVWMGKDTTAAVEGVWDDFGDAKNVSAETLRASNGPTVLLIDRDYYHRTLWSGERIGLQVWLSHYGTEPVRDAVLRWRLETPQGAVLAQGSSGGHAFPAGAADRLTRLSVVPDPVQTSTRATLRLALEGPGLSITNAWDFWIFTHTPPQPADQRIASIGAPVPVTYAAPGPDPDRPLAEQGIDLLIAGELTPRMIPYLEAGGRMLVLGQGIFPEYYTEWKSIGWNSSDNGNGGTVIADHPALAGFPHDGWCDLQFYALTEEATALDLDAWPVKVEPIIRCIDSYKGCRNKAYLFEAAVGSGKLLVCSFNLSPTRGIGRYSPCVENVALFDTLLRYALSHTFRPAARVPAAWLAAVAQGVRGDDLTRAREQQTVFEPDTDT